MNSFKVLAFLPLLYAIGVSAQNTSTATTVADPNTNVVEETFTAVGSRGESDPHDVALSISILEKEDIDRELASNISELIRYEPGVSVGGTGSRFGLTDFSIRGMGGNRVLTLVDGIRIPDEFSFAPFLSSRRDFVDIDSVERVEIARGPVSALWGSDALGGVVAFQTMGPHRYLSDGKAFHTGLKLAYNGADSGNSQALTFAGGGETISGLVRFTNRRASESSNAGSSDVHGSQREKADPQSIDHQNVVIKGTFAFSEASTLTLTLDQFSRTIDSQILSDYGMPVIGSGGPIATVNKRDAMDSRDRARLSAEYRHLSSFAFADILKAGLFSQASQSVQLTVEERASLLPAPPQLLYSARASSFDQTINGFFLQATKAVKMAGLQHSFTYGFDYSRTNSESQRDGATVSSRGVPQRETTVLPTRDFPITKVTQYAFFIQDVISLIDGRLALTPSVRTDKFSADVGEDPIYLRGNEGQGPPDDYDASETSLKLAGLFVIDDVSSIYGHYSQGFRAPPYDDVNVGFANPLGGYKTISNTELASEKSTGVEIGIRFAKKREIIQLSVFRNEYDNFIESFAVAPMFAATRGVDPSDGLFTFQSINRDSVEIKGYELRIRTGLADFGPAFDNWAIRAAFSSTSGTDVTRDQPIDSIDPLNGVLGLEYNSDSRRWGGELILTASSRKDEDDISDDADRMASAGYGVLDLLVSVNPTDRVSINFGLFNLSDKQYIRWIDTAAIGSDSPLRFTQPGFNVATSLRIDF